MNNLPSNTKLTDKFFEYLKGLGLSKKTHKNYKSDISHFSGWLVLKAKTFGASVEELSDALPFIHPTTGKEYKEYLSKNDIAESTINRRLSTLRHLAEFLTKLHVLDYNFMDEVSNISKSTSEKNLSHPIIKDFHDHLNDEPVSKNTVKNYLSDIRQFLDWLDKNHKDYTTN